jgi:hypothetical protein
VNTAAVLADAMTDDVFEVGVDRAVTVSEQTRNSGSAAELNAFCAAASLISIQHLALQNASSRIVSESPVEWTGPNQGCRHGTVIVQNLMDGLAGGCAARPFIRRPDPAGEVLVSSTVAALV